MLFLLNVCIYINKNHTHTPEIASCLLCLMFQFFISHHTLQHRLCIKNAKRNKNWNCGCPHYTILVSMAKWKKSPLLGFMFLVVCCLSPFLLCTYEVSIHDPLLITDLRNFIGIIQLKFVIGCVFSSLILSQSLKIQNPKNLLSLGLSEPYNLQNNQMGICDSNLGEIEVKMKKLWPVGDFVGSKNLHQLQQLFL